MTRAGLSLLGAALLAACAGPQPAPYYPQGPYVPAPQQQPLNPRVGVFMDPSGTVHPSVSGNFGGVRLGARRGGGLISTSLGALDLGAAF